MIKFQSFGLAELVPPRLVPPRLVPPRLVPPRLALAFVLWLLSSISVLADGKAFPPVAISTEVRMPDQRALLVWSNGVERLAIETRIVGEGTNFAWVVPLPAVPRVDATTTGLFPTLAWLTPPKVVHAPPPWPGWMLSVTAILWLMLRVRRGTPVEKVDWVACLGVAGGMLWVGGPGPGGAALAGVALALAVWVVLRVQAARPVWRDFLLVVCILILLVGMLLPALGTAGGSVSAPGAGVEVVDRQVAGVFETTTLSARDPAALGSWLRTNGYRLPPSAEPVIADYVREGWVFVASRIRRDAATSGPTALHPLVFTFPTREPVYPLRLTGVDNGPLQVELFVLGPERARIDGFKVLDARVTAPPAYRTPAVSGGGSVKMRPRGERGEKGQPRTFRRRPSIRMFLLRDLRASA